MIIFQGIEENKGTVPHLEDARKPAYNWNAPKTLSRGRMSTALAFKAVWFVGAVNWNPRGNYTMTRRSLSRQTSQRIHLRANSGPLRLYINCNITFRPKQGRASSRVDPSLLLSLSAKCRNIHIRLGLFYLIELTNNIQSQTNSYFISDGSILQWMVKETRFTNSYEQLRCIWSRNNWRR